ncbi:uncharacterized protein LOC127285082 [Leptopilina boulardi]|uniref:uncharacterized protein LOC127285082 n=1 Tax=Leptopilina boulardi TaxID=63433 RepID=UPI0021F52D74|nr:uncharacterized protein LOC127285082 [Leptopilina boulardi]
MKFQFIVWVLYVSCVFQVKSDYMKKVKIFANLTARKTLEYDQEFFDSLILMLSNMRDLTAYSLFDTWNSTHILFNNVSALAESDMENECIAVEQKKLSDIVDGVAAPLFNCGRHALEFGNPIRKKVQDMHQTSMKIINDLQLIEDTCLLENNKRKNDCNHIRVEELETLLNGLLQQLITFEIEGGTVKLTTLSYTLECNAKVLSTVHNEITNMQKRLKECIK